jgi:hypothetical protein
MTTTHQTTTLHRFPAKKRGNGNVKAMLDGGTGSGSGTGGSVLDHKHHPVYVSHSSVAIMTSPTLHITSNKPLKPLPVSVSNCSNGHKSVDGLNLNEQASMSPSTSSSTSSLPTATMLTMAVGGNGLDSSGGTLNRLSQHLVTHPVSESTILHSTTGPNLHHHSSLHDRHKYFNCLTGSQGRTCLERIIFVLMCVLMVGVFLVAALLCLHIGSGGLKRLSAVMFADQNTFGGGLTSDHPNGLNSVLQPELVDLMDEGIDVVRIKTTEEVSSWEN